MWVDKGVLAIMSFCNLSIILRSRKWSFTQTFPKERNSKTKKEKKRENGTMMNNNNETPLCFNVILKRRLKHNLSLPFWIF